VEIDTTALTEVLARLRRMQGQVGGVIRMIEEARTAPRW